MRRQGSQFTSTEFIKVLAGREIKISMDGKMCLARHRLRRASLADHQICGGLSAGLCQRVRGPRLDQALPRDLPPGRPSFITRVWLVDSRRFRVGQARRVRAECVGDAKWFTEKSTAYAKDRQVFGRAIGQNQGVQFPIARA